MSDEQQADKVLEARLDEIARETWTKAYVACVAEKCADDTIDGLRRADETAIAIVVGQAREIPR